MPNTLAACMYACRHARHHHAGAVAPTVAAKTSPDAKMQSVQWIGKKHIGVKDIAKPCITDAVGCVCFVGAGGAAWG
jgi:hypothetical protein